ncbi:hypothetical protein QJQ45_006785 [Haematococcus lacustris]|nr:hypothetical protein QJQ45_006785 [Haematococcus lacustris]
MVDDDDERTGASVISPALLQQQRVAMAQLAALLQPLQCCCEGKVLVRGLHEVTAADVLALAPLFLTVVKLKDPGTMTPARTCVAGPD